MNFSKLTSIVDIEEKVLEYWKKNNCFIKSNELSKNKKRFTFYDGPPFATGLPHYGHILSGTIKDVVTRYKYQNNHHVDRKFGWDCHGLPVEYEIDKKLGITNRKQIEDMGIDKYNAECKSIVMTYSSQWKNTVERMGRWVDFDNSYKTMDLKFMTSVWYIFKQLFEKDLVYRGYKVMPFSIGCLTPLSNFEANLNYKMVNDPSIVVAFPLKEKFHGLDVCILAWTTTPWTLPSNCGLVVNENFEYVIFKMDNKYYVMLEKRIDSYFKDVQVIKKIMGKELVGLSYEQPFDYYEQYRKRGFFKVLCDDFVSDENGTGIVHTAPGFGEEDYNCFVRNNLIKRNELVPCPVDETGCFTDEVTDFKGMYIKEADKLIIKFLKEKILYSKQISHSYPFCWRSEKPLVYKLVPNWFIRVSDHIDKLLKNNEKINWVPKDVKYKKFHNWLANAKDWAISRNRFWGTPIPIWASDDFSELICVESVDELSKLANRTITDIHREFIDDIVIYKNGKELRRIPEVFDCWFESGSMPYAQKNWPFSINKDSMSMDALESEINEDTTIHKNIKLDNFPADFIGEGIDQTRGWFYTLHVISSLVFNKPAFKNVIVNGIVLAEDGKKMSKKEKNYPDPKLIFDEYGADSLRFYLISSPVVEAQDLKFKKEGVKEIMKTVIIPWSNILKFYLDAAKENEDHGKLELDDWILERYNEFLRLVKNTMEKYELFRVLNYTLNFIDDLSNWYIRIYRKEIRNGHTKILGTLLKAFSIIMAPFMPFYSEYSYQQVMCKEGSNVLKEGESVHFQMYPSEIPCSVSKFEKAKKVIEAIRSLREQNEIMLKTPLKKVTLLGEDVVDIKNYLNIIIRECNILNFEFGKEEEYSGLQIEYKVKPFFETLKKDLATINQKIKMIKQLSEDQMVLLYKKDIIVGNITIRQEDVLVEKIANYPGHICKAFSDFILIIDHSIDEEVQEVKNAREFHSFIQKLRKSFNLKIEDTVYVEVDNNQLISSCLKHFDVSFGNEGEVVGSGEYDFNGEVIVVTLRKLN